VTAAETTQTRRACSDDIDAIAVVLGAAFDGYAWTSWTIDADHHAERIIELQRLAIGHIGISFGATWVTTVDGAVRSVASWLDSDTAIPPAVSAAVAARSAALEGRRHPASVAAEDLAQSMRPRYRHLSRTVVGTHPSAQRRGLARMTVAPGLAMADRLRLEAHLETSAADNVEFYTALGFVTTHHATIPRGGPDLWLMHRPPGGTKA
jgi:hypothetical protein